MQTQSPESLTGMNLVSSDGSKIGKVDGVFVDNDTNEPEWVEVKTGMLGGKHTLVPLAEASFEGSEVRVPYSKDQVSSAPHHDPDEHLSQSAEAELYSHYGLGNSEQRSDSGLPAGGTTGTGAETYSEGRDTSGPSTDNAMTRSEEQLRVGTEKVEAGHAKLRKYVVTENVTQTVPVSREEVRIEREPITDANVDAAYDGPAISEEEHEVTLTEERPVVEKEAVPVERVRLGTETVTEQQQVTEEVRKEQIETDGIETDGIEQTRR